MSDKKSYWESEVISPENFLCDPAKYLKAMGYFPSHKNQYDSVGIIYVKQFKTEQVRIIFSNKRIHLKGRDPRLFRMEGPKELVNKELEGLGLILKPIKQ